MMPINSHEKKTMKRTSTNTCGPVVLPIKDTHSVGYGVLVKPLEKNLKVRI